MPELMGLPIHSRVLVIGASGAGKSTIARQIAQRLSIPFHATDAFYWESGWRPAARDRVDHLLNELLEQPSWVLDGNFEHRWQELWNRADLIIWLDYSLPRVLCQVTRRNLGWLLTRRVVWSANKMTIAQAISGIRHSIRSHGRKRHAYPQYISHLTHANVIRFTCPSRTAAWFDRLGSGE